MLVDPWVSLTSHKSQELVLIDDWTACLYKTQHFWHFILFLILNTKNLNMALSKAELKKQVEYYLSDKNLVNDRFFHEKLSEGKDGWMDLSFILNCNKIKSLKLKNPAKDVADAVSDST